MGLSPAGPLAYAWDPMGAKEIRFEPKDIPLKDDVRVLGEILGEVLKVQGGEALFEAVESVRSCARRRREGDLRAEEDLRTFLGTLPINLAEEVVRAFSAYFSLTNMAERVHRIRRRLAYLRPGSPPQAGGFLAVLQRLKDRGVGIDAVRDLLSRMQVIPVFTAHPTESIRRTILVKEQRIARALVDRIDPAAILPTEDAAALARIREEIAAGWQTEEHRGVRPDVTDEAEHVIFYLLNVIYRVVPPFYEQLADALRAVYGGGANEGLPCPIVRFGSWVGGDMDGNPNAGPETIRETLRRQREAILDRYRGEVLEMAHHLTQSSSRVEIDATIGERIEAYRKQFASAYEAIPAAHREMPYRCLLHLIAARLEATERRDGAGYPGPGDFTSDLEAIAESLGAHRGTQAGLFRVERLLRRVLTFGFHLATLDVREDARVHRAVVGKLLGRRDFPSLPPADRARRIAEALDRGGGLRNAGDDPEVERTLESLRAVGQCLTAHGKEAIGPYIISMAQGKDDALAILLLARWAGLADERGAVPLDIAPLFETVADMEAAPETIREMLQDPRYRAHLEGRGGRQIVMLGYSDSGKESGIAASRWALYESQLAIERVTREEGAELRLFHGRGGTISRGGSKPREAILANPPGESDECLRLTEQGEMIFAKYGLRGIATRTLELLCGGVLEAVLAPEGRLASDPGWSEAMGRIAAEGRAAYRALIYEDPDFFTYFRKATPIDVIERLRIGSRPPSRRASRGIEDLRAIPWVFAWIQSRHLLPGWYGVGSGLEAAVEKFGIDVLRAMRLGWRFFATLLSDVEFVLASADMPIARAYADLAGDVAERTFRRIETEFALTRRWVLEIRDGKELLDAEPVLQRSIRLRNPYVDPMSFLQVELLRRWRDGGRRDPALEQALFSTVKGIARGMQHTG
ncbi:MAG: phosphoenolpyruvate carboxylase [Planctomycetota bacterium]|nr:phosphoenolpyruvate carboxylase [Planctomycetota bacterium]